MIVLVGGGESGGDGETGGGEADDELSAVIKMSPRRDGGGEGSQHNYQVVAGAQDTAPSTPS